LFFFWVIKKINYFWKINNSFMTFFCFYCYKKLIYFYSPKFIVLILFYQNHRNVLHFRWECSKICIRLLLLSSWSCRPRRISSFDFLTWKEKYEILRRLQNDDLDFWNSLNFCLTDRKIFLYIYFSFLIFNCTLAIE
jgi:hypothetical protein